MGKISNEQRLHDFLPLAGYKQDRWGHFQREFAGGTLRVKMQATSVRLEVKYENDKEWFKKASAYFKDIVFAEDGSSVKIDKLVIRKAQS
jgi:hypothetical protein